MVAIKKQELEYLRSVVEDYKRLQEHVKELEAYVERRRSLTILSQDRRKAEAKGMTLDEYRLIKPKRGRPPKTHA